MKLKKYFKFIHFRNNLKGFLIIMTILIVCQLYFENMSFSEIIITDIIVITTSLIVSLIIDWVKIINDNIKQKKSE